MPLPANHRNAILAQLNAAFDALEAGTLFESNEWIHQAFEFSVGGRTYIVILQPEGNASYSRIQLLIKRIPV